MDNQQEYARRIREEGELLDGGKHILTCSNCNKDLVEVWITKKDLDVRFKLRAKCAYCDDGSYDVEVTGGFHLGITDDCIIGEYISQEMDEREAARLTDSYIITTVRRK